MSDEPQSFREAYKRWADAAVDGVVSFTDADKEFVDAMTAWLADHPEPVTAEAGIVGAEPHRDDLDAVRHV